MLQPAQNATSLFEFVPPLSVFFLHLHLCVFVCVTSYALSCATCRVFDGEDPYADMELALEPLAGQKGRSSIFLCRLVPPGEAPDPPDPASHPNTNTNNSDGGSSTGARGAVAGGGVHGAPVPGSHLAGPHSSPSSMHTGASGSGLTSPATAHSLRSSLGTPAAAPSLLGGLRRARGSAGSGPDPQSLLPGGGRARSVSYAQIPPEHRLAIGTVTNSMGSGSTDRIGAQSMKGPLGLVMRTPSAALGSLSGWLGSGRGYRQSG